MSLKDFTIELDAFEDEDIPQETSKLVRAIGLTALRGLVLKTPVDTGRARGNWIVSIGAAVSSDSDRLDPAGGETISDGSAVISRVDRDPFTVVYLQNNLPYIEALEDGSSRQAPGGMLTVTLAEIEGQFG